jgi:hypothetical protein
VLVDIQPEPSVPGWVAGALEQNITQEILGHQHVRALDRRDVDTRGCEVSDIDCRVRLHVSALHTEDELQQTADAFESAGRELGVLG